jgi:hypothetical protein
VVILLIALDYMCIHNDLLVITLSKLVCNGRILILAAAQKAGDTTSNLEDSFTIMLGAWLFVATISLRLLPLALQRVSVEDRRQRRGLHRCISNEAMGAQHCACLLTCPVDLF